MPPPCDGYVTSIAVRSFPAIGSSCNSVGHAPNSLFHVCWDQKLRRIAVAVAATAAAAAAVVDVVAERRREPGFPRIPGRSSAKSRFPPAAGRWESGFPASHPPRGAGMPGTGISTHSGGDCCKILVPATRGGAQPCFLAPEEGEKEEEEEQEKEEEEKGGEKERREESRENGGTKGHRMHSKRIPFRADAPKRFRSDGRGFRANSFRADGILSSS